MTVPEKAVDWAIGIANDNSHGYDQGSRWGADYDCSSLVISAFKYAGVPLTCTYTGNMQPDMLNNGFKDVTSKVTLSNGAGLILGDVLLNRVHHTALYVGNGRMVEATGNELGGVTGGRVGDQTGNEITVNPYRNYGHGGWDVVLRYSVNTNTTDDNKKEEASSASDGYYVVKSGDSLWAIAEKLLGSGARYVEIQRANSLSSAMIYVGQRLKIPASNSGASKEQSTAAKLNIGVINVKLPELTLNAKGNAVKILQFALNLCGVKPTLEVDGDFGNMTMDALHALQKKSGIPIGDVVDADAWEEMFTLDK